MKGAPVEYLSQQTSCQVSGKISPMQEEQRIHCPRGRKLHAMEAPISIPAHKAQDIYISCSQASAVSSYINRASYHENILKVSL